VQIGKFCTLLGGAAGPRSPSHHDCMPRDDFDLPRRPDEGLSADESVRAHRPAASNRFSGRTKTSFPPNSAERAAGCRKLLLAVVRRRIQSVGLGHEIIGPDRLLGFLAVKRRVANDGLFAADPVELCGSRSPTSSRLWPAVNSSEEPAARFRQKR